MHNRNSGQACDRKSGYASGDFSGIAYGRPQLPLPKIYDLETGSVSVEKLVFE